MPDIINLLPDNIANQIAAGEVIQRPASAVKELLENAIDAGATSIKMFVNDAGKALIQVIDNGKGIPPEILPKIFQPYFTTKPAGEGSGLGLQIVKKIIDKHGGKIEVDSQPGQTTFSIFLPKRDN